MSDGVYVYQAETSMDNVTVLYCRTSPEVKSIVNRTLGGLWFTQGIGVAAIKAEVELYVTGMNTRNILLDFYSSGGLMTIEYDGYQRTGRIISEPVVTMVTRAKDVNKRVYTVQFSFGVDQEVAV